MNFMRGRQMVVHDPRLNKPGNPNANPPVAPTPLTPPGAVQTWTVSLTHPVEHIMSWVGKVCDEGRLDALHFMAHGNKAYMQLGAGSLSWANIKLFEKVKGKVGHIVFWSCLVGSDEATYYGHGPIFAAKVAEVTGAKVVACRQNQMYSWNSSNVIDFGGWEGEVFVFEDKGQTSRSFNKPNPFRVEPTLDLEKLIFG
jgi:hypothetical protein